MKSQRHDTYPGTVASTNEVPLRALEGDESSVLLEGLDGDLAVRCQRRDDAAAPPGAVAGMTSGPLQNEVPCASFSQRLSALRAGMRTNAT